MALPTFFSKDVSLSWEVGGRGKIMRTLLIALIELYRKWISPLKPPSCRFVPTCSEYAIQAINKYGAFKGSILAVKRILRCNPFGSSGYDPLK